MEAAGLVVAIVVLLGAIAAIRRDPRITPAELRIQLALIGAFLAIAGAVLWLTVSVGTRAWQAAGAAMLAAWLVIVLPLLARYLSRRLRRPGQARSGAPSSAFEPPD